MNPTLRTHGSFLILGIVGVAIICLATSVYGPGLSPDSVAYVFAADSLTTGDGYTMIGGAPFVHWPPLFPSLLAGFEQIGVNPLVGVRFFNAIVFGLIIFTTGHFLNAYLQSWVLTLLGTALLLVSVVMLRVSIMAWSEPLFVLLVLWFLIMLSKYLTQPKLSLLLTLGVIAGVACLQRYIGFTFIVTGALCIALFTPTQTLKCKLKLLTILSIVSVTPLAIWLARNYTLTSTLTGERPASTTSVFKNIEDALYNLSTWVQPSEYLAFAPLQTCMAIIGAAIITIMIAIAYRPVLTRKFNGSAAILAPVAIFAAVYIFSLLVVRSLFAFYAPIGDRLLSPVYVLVLLFVLLGVEQLMRKSNENSKADTSLSNLWLTLGLLFILAGVLFNEWTVRNLFFGGEFTHQWVSANLITTRGDLQPITQAMIIVARIFSVLFGILLILLRMRPWIGRAAVIGFVCIWLTYPSAQAYFYISTKTDSGAGGYNSAHWKNSDLIHHLESKPPKGIIYSNVPEAIYILSNSVDRSDLNVFPYKELKTSDAAKSRFQSSIDQANADTYLIWVENPILLDPLRDPDETLLGITSMFQLIEVYRFPDGGVHLLKKSQREATLELHSGKLIGSQTLNQERINYDSTR